MPIFEQTVRALLDERFACCALSISRFVRPDAPEHREKGYEIDHLLHVRSLGDRIILIECKDKRIFGDHQTQPPAAGYCHRDAHAAPDRTLIIGELLKFEAQFKTIPDLPVADEDASR
jgi:hypothetical protein